MDWIVGSARAGEAYDQHIFNFISQNEGSRLLAYDDKTGDPVTAGPVQGKVTVGVGFNMDKPGARKTIESMGLNFDDVYSGRTQITQDHVDQLLAREITSAQQSVRNMFPDILTYSTERQMALTDMMFNMGAIKFRGFQKMIAAINQGDWEKAAIEAQDSDWFNQVGHRGPIIVNMLRNG
jgi:GH24 family phage-related lysozyme (muramidase)